MRDDEWSAIERELKRPARRDPEAVARVMARVRAAERETPTRSFWSWLTRPRPISVSPLGGLLAAAVVAGLLALPLVIGRTGGIGDSDAAFAAADRGAGEQGTSDSLDGVQPVQFVLVATEASHVSLVGDFNNWDPEATPLRRTAEDGIWSAVVPLRSGRYLYAFVLDGTRWVTDAAAPRGPESVFGSNSVILVGDGL